MIIIYYWMILYNNHPVIIQNQAESCLFYARHLRALDHLLQTSDGAIFFGDMGWKTIGFCVDSPVPLVILESNIACKSYVNHM